MLKEWCKFSILSKFKVILERMVLIEYFLSLDIFLCVIFRFYFFNLSVLDDLIVYLYYVYEVLEV